MTDAPMQGLSGKLPLWAKVLRAFVMVVTGAGLTVLLLGSQPERPAGEAGEALARFEPSFHKVHYKPAMIMPDAAFQAPDGKNMRWGDFKGQMLLVNFWATWCPPCIAELPSLQVLARDYEGRGLRVIGLSVDTQKTPAEIMDFLKEQKIGSFAAYHDAGSHQRKGLNLKGIPVSLLIDPDGGILYVFEGDADWSGLESRQFLDAVLTGKQ